MTPALSLTERNRLAISQAARTAFLTHGFENVSMDQIAEQANVSKRTIYQHFKNKEQLFQAILADHWNLVFKVTPSLFGNFPSTSASLKHFAKLFLEFLYKQDTIDLFRLLISQSQKFPHLVDKLLQEGKAPFTRELIRFCEQKKQSGELNIKNSERSAAYFIGLLKEGHFWPMMLGFTKQKDLKNKNQLIDEAVEMFIKLYEH